MNRLILIFIAGFFALPIYSEKFRIAILDFKKGTGVNAQESELISGLVRTGMVKKKNFTVIDRENISRVFKEQALVQKGCTDSSCEVQIGKLLAANKIMTGSVSKLGNSYVINALITDVEKGTTDFGESESVQTLDEMNKAVERLTDKISEAMIAEIPESKKETKQAKAISPVSPIVKSAILPGWGQFSSGQRLKGSIFAISFLASIGFLVSSVNEYNSQKENYASAANLSLAFSNELALLGYVNAKNVFSEYESSTVQVRNASIVLIGVYVINLLDILFFSKTATVSSPKSSVGDIKSNQGSLGSSEGLQFYAKTSPVYNQFIDNSYTIQYSWRF